MMHYFHCQRGGDFLFCFCSYGNYMKSSSLFAAWKLALACAVGVAPTLVSAADVVLTKAPPLTVLQAPAYPENLARYHFGAEVKATPQSVPLDRLQLSSNSLDQNTSEAALLCDDPTTGYRLPAGQSSLLVSLSNIENVESISFLNDAAEGDFAVAVPENSPEWNTVAKGVLARAQSRPRSGRVKRNTSK